MILTFVGNVKELSTKELQKIKKNTSLNGINVSEINVELYLRAKQ